MLQKQGKDISEQSQGKQAHGDGKNQLKVLSKLLLLPSCYKNKPKTSQISEQSQGKQAHGVKKFSFLFYPRYFCQKWLLLSVHVLYLSAAVLLTDMK
jgi:hypothetical protein